MRKIIVALLTVFLLLLVGCTQESPAEQETQPTRTVEQEPQTPHTPPTENETAQSGELAVSEEDFLSAQYIKQLPENVTYITADDRAELILLETKRELKNLWISRVKFDEQQKDYVRTERVWWMKKWEVGSKLVLGMALTKEYPAMELSWEDEFGQRERRLIEFTRVFSGNSVTETASLLYFVSPLHPTDLTACTEYYYDMNADGNKEIIRFTQPDKTAGDALMAALKITVGKTVYEYHMLLASDCRCYLADLDGDYLAEIYVSGKNDKGRMLTYALMLTERGIESLPFADDEAERDADEHPVLIGGIEKVEDRILYLQDTAYVLSEPYQAHITYAFYSGQLEPIDGVWTLDPGKTAKNKLGLPVTMEDGTEKTLPIGTEMLPLETDRTSFIKVKTTSGEIGTVSFAITEDGSVEIGGHLADELF